MPNKKKLYEALKAEGYDNFADESAFNSYVNNSDNRKKLFDALKSEGYDNFADEKSFDAYLGYSEPQSNNSGEQESVIDVPSDEMKEDDTQGSYQYKPELQKHILENKPDMFKPKTVDMYGAHDKDKNEIDLMREGRLYGMKSMRAMSTIEKQLDERIKANEEALKDAYEKRDSSMNRGNSFVFGAGASSAPKVNTDAYDETIKNLIAEQDYLTNSKKLYEAAKNDAGFFQGMKDAVDASWITFGVSDLHNAERIANVQKKIESGQELSESEQSLITSLGLQQIVNEQYNELLGSWYKAGMTTTDMVPFMAEMAVSPLSGLGKTAMKASIKKFGEKGAKAIASKILSRTIGDVAGAAGMAVTTGMPSVMANALERQQGYVTTDVTSGSVEGLGFEGGENASDAWRKAITSRTIENWSEMVGQYFSPGGNVLGKGIKKGFSKMGLGKINEFLDNINSSNLAKVLDDFTEQTQWNGSLGEFAEEQVGMIADALLVGDTKWSDITDLDQQLDVALGVGVFGTFMSLLRIGGYRTPKYRARKAVEKADENGLNLFGLDWKNVKELILASPDEELSANLAAHTEFSGEQMKAAFMYANALKAQQAVNTYKEKEKIDKPSDVGVETESAYDEGFETTESYLKHYAKRELDFAESELGVNSRNSDEQQFAQMVMAGADSPVESINALVEAGYSEEQIQKAKDYYTAYHRMNGITDALIEDIDSQIESANNEVDANTNQDNGSVTRVGLRNGGVGHVVEGTVVRAEDGTVDVNNSDDVIYVRLENGEIKMMNPNKDLVGVAWMDSPERLKEYNNTILKQDLLDKAIGEIDWNPATPNPKVGDSFEMNGVPLVVAEINENGLVVVSAEEWQKAQGKKDYAFQTQLIVPVSAYKDWASAQLDAQEEAANAQQTDANNLQTEMQTEANMPESPTSSVADGNMIAENRPMSEEEAATFIFQMERNAVEAPEIELTPENWISEFGEDGLVETPIGKVVFGQNQYIKLQQMGRNGKLGMIRPTLTNPDIIIEDASKAKEGGTAERGTSYVFVKAFKGKDGKRMYYFTSVTIKKDGSEVVISNQEKSINKISRLLQNGNVVWTNSLFSLHPTTQVEKSVPLNDSNRPTSTDNQPAWLGINSPEHSENKDNSNNVQSQENQGDFVSMGKEKAFEVLGNKYGEKMPRKVEVTAKALAEDLRKAQQKLDKAELDYDDAPIGREDKAEKALNKAREEFEAVKREADFWAEMDAEIKSAQVMPGDEAANEILSMEEPLNGLEFAAQMLANGNIKLLQDSFVSETGFGNEESKKYFGLFASAGKGGMTIQKAGERLMEADRENGTNFFDQNDPNAGRNAIIEALGIAKTKKELANIIPNNRSEQARKEQEAEYAAYEAWVEENFHMSVQDYEAYNGPYMQELVKSIITDEEFNDFMSTFVDETINNNQYEQGIIAKSEGSSEVLSGTQPLQAERAGEFEKESGKVDGGVFEENGALPEGASGNEVVSQIEQARAEVDTNPTKAQKEAGNYKKGHVKIDGYDITIENPKGGVRSGTDKNGKKWSITMNNDYGYIRGTEAVDGDHIDVFLSDNPTEGNVFVVDQSNEDGSFDESKVMYGFNSLEEARAAYLSNYEKGWESRIMAITEVSKDEFKKWIDSSHRKTKAFSEYKSVKAEEQKPYTIQPATYTTKKGKVLDMFLVKPTKDEMSRERQSEARFWAKEMKGWYDRKEGGWMLRSKEDADKFAEKIFGEMPSESYDLITMKNVTDGDVTFSEPVKEDEYSPTWQYIISVDKESGFTTLRRDDVSGIIPIGDARFTISATSPQEMLDILRNPLNGMQEVLDAVGVTLENKIKTREMDAVIDEKRNQVASGNKLVSDERYAELRERMRKKLGGQMNIGIDPEILAIGTEMAVYHIEKGARKFAEYAKAMIADLGDAIRPYLKAFYNGARDLPEMQSEGLTNEMTSYDEVSSFDVANFDKPGTNAVAAAETIVKEEQVEQQTQIAKERIKKQSKPKKKTKENVSLLGDLFNQNTEDNETGTNEQRGNRSPKRDSNENRELGSEAREEGSGTSVRRETGSLSGHYVSDETGSGRVHGVSRQSSVKNNTRNFSFGEEHINVPSGDIAKLKANIEAIRTLKEIEESGQPATDAQKEVLSKYVGWGGLSAALDEQKFIYSKGWQADRNWNEKYLPYYTQLRELLTKEEFNDAVQSTNTSHYTPEKIIRGMWNLVQRMGFKGGRINEPAVGVGHIIGLMPSSISEQSIISGTELDSLSGRIAKVLYPDAAIKVQGYETEFAPKSKDLVITNVPFGKTAPYDKALDKALRKKMGSAYNLHNYFIAKGLLELKEGGIGVFVTSSATMDGANSKFREWVAANGIDLIGAIRLPNNAFLKNAGTSVTADILVFRKRKQGETSNGINFVPTTQLGEGQYSEAGEIRTKPIMVNEYFAEHPDMILGTMMTAHEAGSGGLYSGSSQTCVADKGANLAEDLGNAIMRLGAIDVDLSESQNSVEQQNDVQTTDLKNGTLVVQGDNVLVSINGELQPVESVEKKKVFTFNGKKQKVADAVRDYNALKETLKSLIQSEQSSDINPEPIRKKLNKQYDDFVSKYGTLNRNKSLDNVFAEDFEHNLPLSLESVKRVPSVTGKSMVWEVAKGKGILEKRVSYPVEEPTHAESVEDAIRISQSYRGVIDVPYVASLVDRSELDVITEMLQEGLAYREPITGNLVDKETYLSGNVKEKLEQARAMAEEYPEEYQVNVDALAEVQPETVHFGDISYRIGTPWIPEQYINDFALDVLGIRSVDVKYVPSINEFVVSKYARVDDFAKSGQFRTERVGVVELLEYALNQRKPKIVDKKVSYGPMGKVEERIPNEAETQAAAERIMEISDKFVEYIDGRSEIHRELERIYNDKYNNYRLKQYELPAFEHYPNSNTDITLRDHQKKAVQRSLSESTLLAHQVGTGKTFTMITTAMEMRRLGIAKKPMIVVQNATLEDFVKDFYKLYPGAKVLAPGKDERSAENRKRLFNMIATGDFDAIVIPQSFMQFIPDDEGRKKELIRKRIDEYEQALEKIDDYTLQRRMQKEIDALRDTLEGKEKKRSVKDKAKAADRIKAKMEKQLDRRTDDVLTFEQMGIDALFIDEAHNFKKIGFASKMSNVKGVDTSASQRANSLLLKSQYVQEKNGGRNVILATGTPITNTMAEVWTMMKFVSPEILETYNIQSFDDFATTFGVVEPSLEFTATGNFKVADRFKSYVNVPELVKAFRSHTDVVLTSDVKEFKDDNKIPKLKDGQMTNVVIEKNEDLEDVMDILIRRLEEYNEMSGSEKREWSALPLVVFSRAKQAAIDLRLLNPSYEDNPNSKTNHVVRNVLKLYKESTSDKGTQLVFCDSYQSPGEAPKMDLFDYDPDVPRFNLYEDIKNKLIAGGIPANEIAIVNNYDGERRKQLFEKVRNGDVRVLLGSTEKMGVGVNVQDRLYALHHIDAPIRPMDFEQRNGRILRQGNLYAEWGKPVNVITYGVQGTLDATAYDRLRIKQDFINQMMKGDVSGRIMEEQDEEDPSGMTFNQMAATLSGDKTAQLLFVAENDLKKLRNSKRSDFNSKSAMGMTIQSEERKLVGLNDRLELWGKATETVDKYFPDGVTDVKVNGNTITEKFGSSLDPIIERYEDAYSLNRGTAPLKLSLNNGNAEVIVHFDEGKMVYELYAGKEHVVESRQFNGGKGLISSIEHQLKSTKKNYDETKQKIAESKNKIKGLEKAMNAPWGREDELKEAEKKVADLKKKLEDQALENSKKKTAEQPKNEVEVEFDEDLQRKGEGPLTADEVSLANDPLGKVLGQPTRTAGQRKSFAQRERQRMVERVTSLAKKLGLKNVEIVTDASTLSGAQRKAKGFYSKSKRKITIVIPNHSSVFDAEQTLLHEAVGHYGLRELFGNHFDTFLNNVYKNASSEVRERINRLAMKNGWDFQKATEEYLASLAEDTNFEDMQESWWSKIKEYFLQMLHEIGFIGFRGVTLTDNELRYILWRSYENLAEPGRYRSILGEAADIAMQDKLKVGNYSQSKYERERARLLASGLTNSTVAESAAPYTHKEQIEDLVEEFTSIYNSKQVVVLDSNISDQEIESYGLDVEDVRESIEVGTEGFYDPITDKIYIFADVADIDTLESTLFRTSGKSELQIMVQNALNKFNDIERGYGSELEVAERLRESLEQYEGSENTSQLEEILDTYESDFEDSYSRWGRRMEDGSEEFIEALEAFASKESDTLFRIVEEVEGMADDTARYLYEKSVKGNAYRFQEGFQDAMLSLKKLQEAIVKQVGGKLEEWEDAYTAENQMSSRDTSEIENFMFNHFKPMMDAVAKFLRRTGLTYEDLRTYLFAKSGLERNRDFAVRDAIAQREKDGDDVSGIYEAYLQRKQELLQDLKDGTITFREYCEEMDNEAMMIAPDLMGRDYSGLSSLFGEDTFTEDAISEVEQVENLANTDALWNAIKGATQFSLDRAKQSGVMSTDVHKKLSEMFEWYIPMRGWSETKARDVYDYFGRQEGVFNPTIKNAYGRKSLADDPLATIANMAESSIFQGNKNQMKQKLLNLAFDKPTNLITVMDSWIENKGTEDDPRWEYVYPPIEKDDDADVIAAKIKQFEEEMEQKKDAGVAKKLRGKADIPYIATPKEIAEHIIRVKRNGREFVMIINGNPRAAQAINGETNPETYNGIIEQVSRRLNRFMAAAFTTKNPTFIMRNLSRDLIFSNTAVAIKESNAYGKKFRGNQMKVLGNMRGLMKRYQSGKLNMNNPLDKMFQEFIQNGGETGFAQLTSVDEYKKKIQRELKDAKNRGKKISGKKVGRAVMDTIEFYNRCAEDVSRFTVYMTSRQMGRSIQRSVSDAKEITVNFNKRGSGSKAGGFIGFGAQSMRSLYLFFNAAVQALVNFKRLGQKHPVAFSTALSMYAVSGFLMPVVNEFLSSILGGDDDDYENLPEWVRRNNLVISLGKWGGDAMFLTIPLPVEMRAFYGLGETSNQLLAGNVRGKDAAIQIAGQFAEMLPLNFVTDSAGPFNAFTPDAFKPIAQAYVANKDWTGKPIYRDNGFNKELPEWTKAYAGTSKWLVNSAELLNELTGGDKYKSGVVDINPARLEHLFTGYLGGFGDMFLGGYKTISMLWDEDYRNVRNTPVLKAFLNQSDERTSYYQVKKDYASFKDEYEDTVRRLNGYERELKQPETALKYAERMDFLQRSPQIKRYEVMKTYEKELNKLYQQMREIPDPEVQKAITTTINQIKSDAVTILKEIK